MLQNMSLPTLRPLSTGQILDRGIRLYRRHFLTYIGIVALAQIPATAVTILAGIVDPAPTFVSPLASFSEQFMGGIAQSTGIGSGLLNLAVFVISFLLSTLGAAAQVQAAAASHLDQQPGILEAYRAVLRFWGSLIGAYLLVFLAILALLFWWLLVPFLGWFTGLGMMMFFGLVVIPFVVPGIIIERQPVTQVIQRAWSLARRRFWWLVGFMLLLGLFGQIVVTGPALLLGFGIQATIAGSIDTVTLRVVQQILGLLLNLIYLPLQLTCVTLLYFDARVRTEGLDLALQTAVAEGEGTVETVLAQPPPATAGLWPTWEEFAYFFGLTLGFGVLCFLFYIVAFAIGLMVMSGLGGL